RRSSDLRSHSEGEGIGGKAGRSLIGNVFQQGAGEGEAEGKGGDPPRFLQKASAVHPFRPEEIGIEPILKCRSVLVHVFIPFSRSPFLSGSRWSEEGI